MDEKIDLIVEKLDKLYEILIMLAEAEDDADTIDE